MLPRLGYMSMFPHALAHGPIKYDGLGMTLIASLILAEKVTLLIRHLRSESSVGKQMRIMLKWAQMSVGTLISILEET
eukprot:11350480-Ditylum_brightwellii.AAC.1